jgi:FMN phosphatase YigB (HAD superfamily)
LDTWIQKIFCACNLGFQKPQAEYFQAIIKRLKCPPNHLVMIGDSFSSDVQGAVQAGLSAIWFNPLSKEERQGAGYCTVHALSEVEAVLQSWFPTNLEDSFIG